MPQTIPPREGTVGLIWERYESKGRVTLSDNNLMPPSHSYSARCFMLGCHVRLRLYQAETRVQRSSWFRTLMPRSFIWAEQAPQAHWWPHGAARCDLGLLKQIMHVDWPPMVDSGASGRPVLNCASASDITAAGGGGGGLSSAAGAAVMTAAVAPALDEPAGTCRLAWPTSR
eukprot:scaffold22315_cov50-Phaeocystis_antarctica.AAC.3